MKKLHFWLLVSLFAGAFAVVSCGDDDPITPSTSTEDDITNTTKDSTQNDTTAIDTTVIDTTGIDTTIIDTTVVDTTQIDTSTVRFVAVVFNGSSATVNIPSALANEVTAKVDGANVTLTNTNITDEIEFFLSGSSANGSFTYNGQFKSTLRLGGLNLTSNSGAAIDIQCGKRMNIILEDSTVNTLADYANGTQKACLYCKGHIEFEGSGTLNVTGNMTHAIKSKEYIQLKKSTGTINILGAVGDAIHAGQYYMQNGGTVKITSTTQGDGIQVETLTLDDDVTPDPDKEFNGQMFIKGGTLNIEAANEDSKAIKADGDITISGGTFQILASGKGSRGIQTDGNMVIGEEDSTTNITIQATGAQCTNSEHSDDPHRCMGMKIDGNLTINGGTIVVTNTGSKSRGIKVGGTYTKNGGTVSASIKN